MACHWLFFSVMACSQFMSSQYATVLLNIPNSSTLFMAKSNTLEVFHLLLVISQESDKIKCNSLLFHWKLLLLQIYVRKVERIDVLRPNKTRSLKWLHQLRFDNGFYSFFKSSWEDSIQCSRVFKSFAKVHISSISKYFLLLVKWQPY